MNRKFSIRQLTENDCEVISEAFAQQNWNKPLSQYKNYLREQDAGKRQVLIAEFENEFSGYLTIVWQSHYSPFREKNIPEIVDLNVLIKFRNRGIGAALMDAAESLIAERFNIVGIGVGLTGDYGAAQRLYVKRGYIPDGRGISQNGRFLKYGDKITIDDDLNLYFTKDLNQP
ncbi:MAG TPA: GNAT family N-acetyltransferase [Pyrinomonadaceae bacterium]|nr:GNAT family N-acetyltransferase [Pyrinomonadaceae bacterium]